MAYCDYEFYTTSYFGNVIAEEDFPRLAEKASAKLDMITFDRAKSVTSDDLLVKVKKATCEIADALYDIEKSENSSRQNGGVGIASVSSGSESISYNNNSKIGQSLFDKTAQTKICYDCAREYLTGTGLLFAGI